MIAVSIPNQQFFTMFNFSAWLIIQLVAILKQHKILLFCVPCTVNKLHPVFRFSLSINVIGEASILFEYLKCSRKKANLGSYINSWCIVLWYNMQALVWILFNKDPCFIKNVTDNLNFVIVKFESFLPSQVLLCDLMCRQNSFLIGVHIWQRYQKTNTNIQNSCQHFV